MKRGPKPKYEHLNCTGWYGILYKPDDKFKYIGAAINIKARWCAHRTATKSKHYNDEFHNDLRANPDNYECIVLMEYDGVIKDRHELYEKLVPTECFLIEHFKLLGHPIVTTSEDNSHTRKHTDKTKIKMRESHKGHPVSDDAKTKIGESFKGARWMHKPNKKSIFVKKCDIKQRLDEGYIFGRK